MVKKQSTFVVLKTYLILWHCEISTFFITTRCIMTVAFCISCYTSSVHIELQDTGATTDTQPIPVVREFIELKGYEAEESNGTPEVYLLLF